MPASAFPLTRRRGGAYRLSSKFTWRVVKFSISEDQFRLLVAFRNDICSYEAVLGKIEGKDTKVLASYEFHGSHPGWHVHANCDSIDEISLGFRKSGREFRLPSARSQHRRNEFDVNEGNALEIATSLFGITGLPTEQWTLI